MLNNLKSALAVIALVREIMNNKQLLESIRKAVDALEVAFDQLPGDFPDNLIDKIQAIIGDPTPDDPLDLPTDLTQ